MSDFSQTSIDNLKNFTTIKTSSQLMKKVRTAVEEGILDPDLSGEAIAGYFNKNNFLTAYGLNFTPNEVDRICYSHALGENSGDNPITDLMVTNYYVNSVTYKYEFRNA